MPQPGKELFGSCLLFGLHAGVDLGDIDGATGQEITGLDQFQQESDVYVNERPL